MNDWAWVILVLVVQLGCILLKPRNIGKGKYITMPLRRALPKIFDHMWCRLFQILLLIGIQLMIDAVMHGHLGFYLYCVGMIALYLDDYLSDDDDRKKFWDMVRNKIKWKMELPKPVSVGGKTAS
jgi:hypothetical protein